MVREVFFLLVSSGSWSEKVWGKLPKNSRRTEYSRVVIREKGRAVFAKWIYATLYCATGELHLFNWHIFTDPWIDVSSFLLLLQTDTFTRDVFALVSPGAAGTGRRRQLSWRGNDRTSICEDFRRHFGKNMKWLTLRAEQFHQNTKD